MNFPLPRDLVANEISNSHSYQSYQRQRQLTLGDLLLENRIVFLQGEIHYANANDVVMKLLYLQSENRPKDIHFYLNSPGGSVTATLAISLLAIAATVSLLVGDTVTNRRRVAQVVDDGDR